MQACSAVGRRVASRGHAGLPAMSGDQNYWLVPVSRRSAARCRNAGSLAPVPDEDDERGRTRQTQRRLTQAETFEPLDVAWQGLMSFSSLKMLTVTLRCLLVQPIEDVGKSQSTPAATCADGVYVAYGCMMRFWLHYVRFFFSSRKFTSAPKRRAGSHLTFGQPKLSQVQLATVFMDGEEFAC